MEINQAAVKALDEACRKIFEAAEVARNSGQHNWAKHFDNLVIGLGFECGRYQSASDTDPLKISYSVWDLSAKTAGLSERLRGRRLVSLAQQLDEISQTLELMATTLDAIEEHKA